MPSAASVFWTPAGAHHSLVIWVWNDSWGFFTTRTVTGFRFGFGVGVGLGVAVGMTRPGPSWYGLGDGSGTGLGVACAIGRGVDRIVGSVGTSGGGSTTRSIRRIRW